MEGAPGGLGTSSLSYTHSLTYNAWVSLLRILRHPQCYLIAFWDSYCFADYFLELFTVPHTWDKFRNVSWKIDTWINFSINDSCYCPLIAPAHCEVISISKDYYKFHKLLALEINCNPILIIMLLLWAKSLGLSLDELHAVVIWALINSSWFAFSL